MTIMKTKPFQKQNGVSLIELMVSITLGLLILLGLTTIFVNNSKTQTEIEKNNRQQENGRYAMQLLADDVRTAGYFDIYFVKTAPTALPSSPCAVDLPTLDAAMAFHVQGYDNSNGGLTCITDVKANTDVLVVRHAATCRSANPVDANCDSLVDGPVFLQVSGCQDDLPTGHVLANTTASFTLKTAACDGTKLAPISRLRTNIYFIANNNVAGDGMPTLKRAELTHSGVDIVFSIVPLVDGIENLQVLYGLASGTAAGTPSSYDVAPSTAANWWNVMAVKISLLSRNESESAGYNDAKTYDLSGTTVGPFNDKYRRHVYSSTVSLSNPAGRRL